MADRERLLARLRKLLALGDSPNEHEASTARSAAASLMRRHGLTREEAEAEPLAGYYELPMGARGWGTTWRFALVTAAARSCGAEAVCLQAAGRRKVRIVGERDDVERARDLYLRLLDVVRDLEQRVSDLYGDELAEYAEWGGARAAADSFRRGVVYGIALVLASVGRDGPAASSLSEPATVPLSEVSLARVSKHAGRVKDRYDPTVRPLDLDDATVPVMFDLGERAAETWVVVEEGGSVGLKDMRRKKETK